MHRRVGIDGLGMRGSEDVCCHCPVVHIGSSVVNLNFPMISCLLMFQLRYHIIRAHLAWSAETILHWENLSVEKHEGIDELLQREQCSHCSVQ